MNALPNELIIITFNFIDKITDKRQFLRTCKYYNKLTKHLIKYTESKFAIEYGLKKYCVENFTSELCHDSYFDMIPKSYLNKNYAIMELLIKFGRLELLKFMIDKKCELQYVICDRANQYCNYQNWTNMHGCEICRKAAQYGDLDILKWAKENGCKMPNTCEIAAENGHLHIIKWAIRNGCKWNTEAFENAAKNGHLDIVGWTYGEY